MENLSIYELSQISQFLSLREIGYLAILNSQFNQKIQHSFDFWQHLYVAHFNFRKFQSAPVSYRQCYQDNINSSLWTLSLTNLNNTYIAKPKLKISSNQFPQLITNSVPQDLHNVYYWTDKCGNLYRKKQKIGLSSKIRNLVCDSLYCYGLDENGILWKISASGYFEQVLFRKSHSPPKLSWIAASGKDLLVGSIQDLKKVWVCGDNHFHLSGRWYQPIRKLQEVVLNFEVKFGKVGQYGFLLEDTQGRVWDPTRQFISLIHPVIATSVGYYHALFLDQVGRVYGIGQNTYLQMGASYPKFSHSPLPINDLPPISQIAAGFYYSAFLDETGQIWIVGTDHRYFNYNVPTRLSQFFLVKSISAGYSELLVLGQAFQTERHYQKLRKNGEIVKSELAPEYNIYTSKGFLAIRYFRTNGSVEFTQIPEI